MGSSYNISTGKEFDNFVNLLPKMNKEFFLYKKDGNIVNPIQLNKLLAEGKTSISCQNKLLQEKKPRTKFLLLVLCCSFGKRRFDKCRLR